MHSFDKSNPIVSLPPEYVGGFRYWDSPAATVVGGAVIATVTAGLAICPDSTQLGAAVIGGTTRTVNGSTPNYDEAGSDDDHRNNWVVPSTAAELQLPCAIVTASVASGSKGGPRGAILDGDVQVSAYGYDGTGNAALAVGQVVTVHLAGANRGKIRKAATAGDVVKGVITKGSVTSGGTGTITVNWQGRGQRVI